MVLVNMQIPVVFSGMAVMFSVWVLPLPTEAHLSLSDYELENILELKTDSQIPKLPSTSNDALLKSLDPPTIETCNKSVVVSHNMTEYWMSPQYDGGITSYNAETYTCQLTLTIPEMTLYILNMEMQSPSEVFDTLGCTGDCLVYTSMGASQSYCGDMSAMQWTEMQLYESEPKTVTLTFMSKNSDGGVAGGFNLKITAMEAASH